jgi:hypothetical protein
MESAVANWYMSLHACDKWIQFVDKVDGNTLAQQVTPNLDKAEIGNTIADLTACQIRVPGRLPFKMVGFNAECGMYWSEFVALVQGKSELLDPYLFFLNK